jgi:hypothetical protein
METRSAIHSFRAAIAAACMATCSAIDVAAARADDSESCPPRRYAMNGYERAGYPQEVACRARPSDSPANVGYVVGGGAPFHGEPRYINEGTWGWDYSGIDFQRCVQLGWWHGQRSQGGAGAYKTDGPRLMH